MPTIESISVLVMAALPLMGSPGPATVGLAAAGAAFGVRRGLLFLLGIIIGTTTVLIMVTTGVTGLVLAIPGVAPVIVVAGCAYILYLAYKIATAPPISAGQDASNAPSVSGGILLALANVKAYAAFGAVISSVVVVAGHPTFDAIVKVGVLASMIVTVNFTWLVLGATFAGLLNAPKLGRAINIGFAITLVLSVAFAFAV